MQFNISERTKIFDAESDPIGSITEFQVDAISGGVAISIVPGDPQPDADPAPEDLAHTIAEGNSKVFRVTRNKGGAMGHSNGITQVWAEPVGETAEFTADWVGKVV